MEWLAQLFEDINPIFESVGFVAAALLLVSFLMRDQTKIRIINMTGCVVFVAYGILIHSLVTIFMNVALVVVHVVFLARAAAKAKKAKQADAADAAAEQPDGKND